MILLAIDWLNEVPPIEFAATLALGTAIVSGLVSYLVALTVRRGVMEQIRNENTRFETKLQHERQEKKIEREMEMRRDVFMTVCDGIARGAVFLAKYADVDMTLKDHQALINDAAPGLYRLHLSGNEVTLARLVAM